MRSLIFKWIIAGVLSVLILPALVGSQTPNITGTYVLYREGDLFGKVVGYMRISQQNSNKFSIGIAARTGNPAMDWHGNGEINGNRGFYSWRFDDGKQGQTDFTIDKEGNLHGHVQGPGIDWKYVARRQ
jgi:hypothetical protein